MSAPVPGWYVNPDGPGRRFWDGGRWTDYTDEDTDSLPASIPPPPGVLAGYVPPPREPREPREPGRSAELLVVVGYVTAVMLPVVGLVLGIVCLTRVREPSTRVHGVWIVVLSAVATVAWLALLGEIEETLDHGFALAGAR
jgi:hypothetical protein